MSKNFSLLATFFVISALLPISHSFAQVVRPIIFPINGKVSFRNDFSEPRGGGTRSHLGIDIISDKMTPVLAVTDGEVSFIAIPEASWGYAITIVDSEGYSYRYLHLNNDTPGTDDGLGGVTNAYAPNLGRGTKVTKGQILGWVGDSGNAEAVGSHLHFEIMDQSRTNINPYDSLISASGNQNVVTSSVSTTINHGLEVTLKEEEQFIAQRNLQEGMIDKDVTTLHTELKALGYYSGTLGDKYTSATREAVRSFQNSEKILATGIADAETRNILTAKVKLLPTTTTSTTSTSNVTLKFGVTSTEVRVLQERLKVLGFFSGDATGYFGPVTERSLKAFQTANNLDPVGFVGPKTRLLLNSSSTAVAPVVLPTIISTSTPSGVGTTTSSTFYIFTRNLQRNFQGEDVLYLQTLLKTKGYFDAVPNGYFGPLTEKSVTSFQTANGLDPVGVVGPKTRAILNKL